MATGKPTKSSWAPLLAIGAVILVGLAVAGALRLTQGDSGEGSGTPSPQDLPSDVVAVVVGAPASLGTVTKPAFDHAIDVAAASDNLKSAPKPGDKKYRELEETALGELLDSIWLQAQAKEMGVSVTPREVSAELAKLKKQSFKSGAEYQHFIDESHYTQADIDERVKIQILSTQIQDRLGDRATGKRAKQRAFADFIKRYNNRWKSRTVCAPAFVIARCSNGKETQG